MHDGIELVMVFSLFIYAAPCSRPMPSFPQLNGILVVREVANFLSLWLSDIYFCCLHSAIGLISGTRTPCRRLFSNPPKDSALGQTHSAKVIESNESAADLAHGPPSWHRQPLVVHYLGLCICFHTSVSEGYAECDAASHKWGFGDGKGPVGLWYREKCVCGEAIQLEGIEYS
jgi:hypothetical protein